MNLYVSDLPYTVSRCIMIVEENPGANMLSTFNSLPLPTLVPFFRPSQIKA